MFPMSADQVGNSKNPFFPVNATNCLGCVLTSASKRTFLWQSTAEDLDRQGDLIFTRQNE